jgi:hypothetical protein
MATNDVARRFARRRTDDAAANGENDALAELHAEVVLLREENARLKAAEFAGPDIEGLLSRTQRLAEASIDHGDSDADEATRVLIEGLAIRESLLEICRQIERAMSLFEIRLRALPGAGQQPELRRPLDVHLGHWFEPPTPQGRDGDGARAA